MTNAKTLAQTIIEYRTIRSPENNPPVQRGVAPVVKGNPNKYFAQVFQALRIAVNDEFGALKEMLEQTPAC